MHNLKTACTHLFSLILTCFWCSAPQAAAVTNLSNQPQIIEVPCNCDSPQVTVTPGETWRTAGKAKIRYHGREFAIGEADEYAIWNNGDFGPQRYHRNASGLRTR